MEKTVINVVIGVIVMAVVLLPVVALNFNDTEYEVTITDKERIVDGEISKYLVFAEDKQGKTVVFENTDALLRLKFDSSDIQGQLKEGHTYKVTVVGYRVSFLSMYQNIIGIEEIKTS